MAGARLGVEIFAALGSFREDMGKAAAISEASAKRIESAFTGVQTQVASAGRKALNALVGTLGTAAIARELSVIREKVIDEARSFAQLEAVLASTGHAAGLTTDDLRKLGQEVKAATVFDDDDIRKAETALLRFRDVQGEVFRDVIRLAPSVATVLGIELPAAAILLGRALGGNDAVGMRALKAAGLLLSEQLIDNAQRMIEVGDKAGSMRLKLDEIRKSIGGAGGADAQGLYGQAKNLSRALDDLQKTFGRKLFGNDSAVAKELTLSMQGLAHAIENVDALRKRITLRYPTHNIEVGGGFYFGIPTGLPKFAVEDMPKEPLGRDTGIKAIDTKRVDEEKAAQGQKIRALEQAADQIDLREKEGFKQRADGAAAFYGHELAVQKSYLDRQQIQTEFAYARGELTIQEFHDAQKKAVSDAMLATVQANEKTIAASKALIGSGRFEPAEKAAEQAKIDNLYKQSLLDRTAFGTKLIQLDQKQTLEVEKLGDAYGELAERIALANGEDAKASAIAFARENREKRRGFESLVREGGPNAEDAKIALSRIDTLGRLGSAQGRLSEQTRAYGNVVESLGIAQARIDLQAQVGAISEIDAINKKSLLSESYISILTKEADAYEVIALALGKDTVARADALKTLAQMRLAIDQIAATPLITEEARKSKQFVDALGDSFGRAAEEAIVMGKSFKDVMKGLEQDLLRIVTRRLVTQPLEAGLNSFLGGMGVGSVGAGGTGAGANWGAMLAKLASAYFGGGSAASAGWTSGYDLPMGGYATGTNYARGGWSMVGERGPELINLPRGAQVIPNHELVARREAKSNVNNYNTTIYPPPGVSRKSAAQAANEVTRRQLQAARFS